MSYENDRQTGSGGIAAAILIALVLCFLVMAAVGFLYLTRTAQTQQLIVRDAALAAEMEARRAKAALQAQRQQLLAETEPVNIMAGERISYRQKDLAVDLGVGLWAWPLPMDWDGDGDLDLIVSCPDVPYGGTYFFENPGGDAKMPVFLPAKKVGDGMRSVQVSYVRNQPRVLTPGTEWTDFLGGRLEKSQTIFPTTNIHHNDVRANQWKYVDYDGDGVFDLTVGVGDWTGYGWDNAFNAAGEWTREPLHGYVYVIRNRGSSDNPEYENPRLVEADGKPVDVFGMPSPSFADFDGDGDLDLICGEFLDGFTYFENTGTRRQPVYAAGRRLMHDGRELALDLQMITPTAVDWDLDGDEDLIAGDEDGRVAFIENSGVVTGQMPAFLPPKYFQQQAEDVKFGALVTPCSVDWDDDGDEDLICGNTAGYIGFIENLDGGDPPKWAPPQRLKAEGETIRIQAGPNGSIQGTAEAKWGYTTLSVADWDHDGRKDIVVNSIWGKVVWYRNIGTAKEPELAASQAITVQWPGTPPKPAWNWWDPKADELATQWRTTPLILDVNEDGLNDLVMLDHEGYLCLFPRTRRGNRDAGTTGTVEELLLLPGQRIFLDERGQALRLNAGIAGKSGRRKFCLVDWDGDGRLDLIVNGKNVDFHRNIAKEKGAWTFRDEGPMFDVRLAGHTTSPTVVDWDRDGKVDLLVGAEDGFLYHFKHSEAKQQ